MNRWVVVTRVALLFPALCLFCQRTAAVELVRGPYLQLATPESILIRWRTDVATTSVVAYGSLPDDLSFGQTDQNLTTEHEVRLDGLTPKTLYFYSIGTPDQALASGFSCRFFTPPPAGTAQATRVWVIGDSGGIGGAYGSPEPARDAYYRFVPSRYTDVWLTLGDNAYDSGTEGEYQVDFFDPFAAILRQTAVWSTIGNHETYSAPLGQPIPYLTIFSFPTNGEAGGFPSGTERYYSFDHGNIHFICLDSESQSRATNGPMANWLRADLAQNTNLWTIAIWHSPPYSKGSHDSDWEMEQVEMRQNFVPLLEDHGVDLVVGGHSHIYERSFLLRGHYGRSTTLQPWMILDNGSGRETETGAYFKPVSGPNANHGTVYVVAGNASSPDSATGLHPAMFMYSLQRGSLVLDIHTNRLEARLLLATGDIGDFFTLLKQDPEPLQICHFSVENDKLIAGWKSRAGRAYQLEQANDPQATNWQPASDIITATATTTLWTNQLNSADLRLFYRVRQMLP